MIIATLLESNETRVAITPAAVKDYIKLGFDILIEQNAGLAAGYADTDYEQAGASILSNRKTLLKKTNVLVCVNEPPLSHIKPLQPQSLLIAPIQNEAKNPLIAWACKQQISIFSMNDIPRISRAQSMDSLSSQANLAGYRAVIEAVAHYQRAVPMMMTAAGMIQPAKVLILGAGVAGLQAIATAKRLGAVVYAFDVRHAAKEQVESLGAEFVEVSHKQDAETAGGYASEVSEEYKRLQAELIDEYARLANLIICTALIPNKPAPRLISKETIELMRPGSVIVDLAAARGGNCALSQENKTIQHQGVTIIGNSHMAGLIPATASDLYANNVVHLLRHLMASSPQLHFDANDEVNQQALLCHNGIYLPFNKKKEVHHA